MKVQILTTPGCSSCVRVEKMLDEIKVKYEIIDITKNPGILQKYQVMSAPGIVINGKLEFTGVPSKNELERKINTIKNN
ncbi:thioredoxin family protein [Candidatus Woesearchaeota archaeon]|jgi:glutaredoxin|nr:thioredoxin family protein [Candidatus Woesearchaeota archaeon]MBT5739916.1 thioredoxin family protein [Candidatus Woesearchaeota archaeon]